MDRIYSLFILAWGLIRSLCAPLFGKRRGLRAFQESYAADRLISCSIRDRQSLPTFGSCIACGLCDIGEGGAIVASHGVYAGVMDLMLASSRNMPDFDAAALSFQAVGLERLEQLQMRCPTRVPMRAIAEWVIQKAERLESSPYSR